MALHIARLGVSNERKTSHKFFIEPFTDEYTLLPKGLMTLISIDKEHQPYFHVDILEDEEWTTIWVENSSSYFIIYEGRRIIHMGDCGESKDIEQDIEELRQSGKLGEWLKD